MRKSVLFAVVVSVATSFSVSAEPASCETVSALARDVMRNRQANLPMAQMMKATEGMDLAQSMIKAAYKESRYSSAGYQENAITDFENTWYMACLESKKK